MWPRMQPATLLTLALCSLLLHPALGFPSARQALAKSARGDDLISGSDFLSVFIGATVPRTRPRSRNYKVSKRPDSVALEESITRTSYFDDASDSSETSFGTRTIPKGGYPLPAESLARSSKVLREPDVSQTDSEQDIFGEVSTRSAGSSTAIVDEIDVLNKNEPQNLSHPNTPLIGASAQDKGVEPTGESSITNSKRIEYLSKTSAGKESDSVGNLDQVAGKSEVVNTSTSLLNSETLDLNTTLLEQHSSTNLDTSSESEAANNISSQIQNDYSNNNHHDSLDSFYKSSYNDEENVATPPDWSSSYFTTEENTTQNPKNETLQVISVRVSSSVAHIPAQQNNKIDNDSKNIFTTLLDSISQSSEKEINSPSAESVSLVTEEQPAATSVQRSQFSVEEASPSSSVISVHQESSFSNIQSQNNAFTSSGSIESPVDPQSSPVSYHTSISTATSGSRVQFYSEPPSYHRSASSVAETIQRTVIAQQQQSPPQEQSYGQVSSVFHKTGRSGVNNQEHPNESTYDSSKQTESNYQTSNPQRKNIAERINGGFENQNQDVQSRSEHVIQTDTNRAQKSYEVHHQEPQERNYELPEEIYVTPERAYSAPEQNYEVDESVSVMTNGRAHGVQFPSVTTPAQEPDTAIREFHAEEGQTPDSNSKFGYVVEGRNYRKYQVEERTPDGFIVGEYGVVRHDDGSLRGVRYTADGTTSPRLIYEALINFLKL